MVILDRSGEKAEFETCLTAVAFGLSYSVERMRYEFFVGLLSANSIVSHFLTKYLPVYHHDHVRL